MLRNGETLVRTRQALRPPGAKEPQQPPAREWLGAFGEQRKAQVQSCLLWLGPDTVAPPPTLFSQDGFCCLVLSTYLSRNECPWGSSLALGPSPTEPPMHSYLKPLDGQPLSPPHLVVQSLKRKKAKKKKKKKHFPISRCERNRLPQGSLAVGPVLSLDPLSWLLLPTALCLSLERRSEAKSPRVGLLGPMEIKMELVKENVRKKKSQI